MHEFNSAEHSSNVIEVPKKVHRSKVINNHKDEPMYPDVDKGNFCRKLLEKQCSDLKIRM